MSARKRRFGFLIRLLPLEIREPHGDELDQVLRAQRRDAGRGVRGAASFWRSALADLFRTAPRQHVEALAGDLRFACRALRARPLFALSAIGILALGIGASAVLFTIVNSVLLRPLPYPDPDRLALIWVAPADGGRTWLSPPEVDDLVHDATSLESVAALSDLRLALTDAGEPEELQVVAASASLFDMLGVRARRGRLFTKTEDVRNGPAVVVLSDGLWRRRFGSAPDIDGRSIVLDGRPYVVAGVLPPSFNVLPPSSVFPSHVDAWVPLESHLQLRGRDVRFLHALARVRPDVPVAHARAELSAIGAAISREHGAAYRGRAWTFSLVPMQQDLLRGVRPALLVLFAIATLVLVSAAANVAALLVARGESRRREMAIRIALGASRARIVRQLFTEGWALAASGALLAVAAVALAPLVGTIPALARLPRFADISADARVVGFLLVVSFAAALVFAAAPAIDVPVRGAGPAQDALRTSTRGRHTRRVLRGVAVVQVVVATVVLILALGLTRQLAGMLATDPGFSPEGLVTFRVSLTPKYATGAAITRVIDEIVNRVEQVPGVEAAAAVTQLPLSGAALGSSFAAVDGTSSAPVRVDADLRGATPGYFDAMGITIVEGRGFSADDRATAQPVAVVDQLFARRLWPGTRAVGRRFEWIRQPGVAIEVIGVVAPVRHRGFRDAARETVYRPHTQYPRPSTFVVARGSGDAAAIARSAAAAVHAIDPAQPVADMLTMEARMGEVLAEPMFGAGLSAALAALAILLAGAGVYGLQAFLVALRRRELGIRLALGASSRELAAMVMRDGAATCAAGVAIGVPLAALAAGVLPVDSQHLSFDGFSAGAAALVVALATLLACWIPALRAARVDPALAFRGE